MPISIATKEAFEATPNDPRHGTYNGYTNLGCRCDRCRQANRDKCREYTHRVGLRRPMDVFRAEQQNRLVHGTERGYTRGCRCTWCRQAATEAKRERRAKSAVPCSHGCGRMVDSINRKDPSKPHECHPCSLKRIHAERRSAA